MTRSTTTRCSPSRGPEARELVARSGDGELPKRFRTVTTTSRASTTSSSPAPATRARTGSSCSCRRRARPTVWDALTEAGAAPIGLGARDTLRLEVCFHLYGNDLSEDRNPIEAGLGWCCKEATGFIGADKIAAARENGTAEQLVPFVLTGPGHRPPGQPDHRRRRGHVRHAQPLPEPSGIGMAYLPTEKATPGTPFEIDVRGKPRTAEVREKPLYRKE